MSRAPEHSEPGVHVYWQVTRLLEVVYKAKTHGPRRGTLHVFESVDVVKNDGFVVSRQENEGKLTGTKFVFSSDGDERPVDTPSSQGRPIFFEAYGLVSATQVLVGPGKVSRTRSALVLRGQTGTAWRRATSTATA